jgi:hypothetical protein
VWSFAFNALAVTVLRYKRPDIPRGWKVPLNLHVGGRELPLGLFVIAFLLFSAAIVNLFTKEMATISGLMFTTAFFAVFIVSERITARQRAGDKGKLDQFQLTAEQEVGDGALRARPGSALVPVRDYNTLSQLDWALDHTPPDRDVIVLTIRLLRGPSAGAALAVDELFTDYEQTLFTRVVAVAERHGRNVKLLVVPSTNIFDAVAQTVVRLKSSEIIVGESATMLADEQAHLLGDAWDRTPKDSSISARLIVLSPDGGVHRFSLGAHAPDLPPQEIERIHLLWVEATKELGPSIHHRDVVSAAVDALEEELHHRRATALERLKRRRS